MKLTNLSTLVLIATSFIACDKGSESSFSENLSTTTVLETINSLSFNEDIDEMVAEKKTLPGFVLPNKYQLLVYDQ